VTSEYEIGPIAPEEVRPFIVATVDAFLEELHDEDVDLWARMVEPERTLVARAGGAIVASSALFSMQLAVPGGAVPMAGVTAVGVDPVHRRRGLLDRMMRGHLEAIHARGEEAVSALYASEAGIYGRWGYGQAMRNADLKVASREGRLLAGPAPDRPRAGEPPELLAEMRAVYDTVWPTRPGMLARDDLLWEHALRDAEHHRAGAGRLRALTCAGGYALYMVRDAETDGRPDGVIELRELVAATTVDAVILWEHLLSLALTRRVQWKMAPLDDPIIHMVDNTRAVASVVYDAMYVRLVDIPRALAQRSYAAPLDVVLEVRDEVCPWNAGRWRLAGTTCEPTSAPADLALGPLELGAAYLGGTTLAALAAAGRVEERTAGAVAAASHAFKGVREPWCPESF